MEIRIHAQNIKCQGCVNTIREGLEQDPRIREVQVDLASGLVSVEADEDVHADIAAKLAALGYPEKPA